MFWLGFVANRVIEDLSFCFMLGITFESTGGANMYEQCFFSLLMEYGAQAWVRLSTGAILGARSDKPDRTIVNRCMKLWSA